MTIDDYSAVMELMQSTPGMRIREADSRAATQRYLERNPGLSFVAEENQRIQGCAMSGHDGRRGYLQHVVVRTEERKRGLATGLVEACLAALEAQGIEKVHLDVMAGNDVALEYWTRRGWVRRDDLHRFSMIRSGNPNA